MRRRIGCMLEERGLYTKMYVFAAGVALVSAVVGDPGGATSTILSLLPPFAPVLMPFRMATGTVPGGEVLLAAVVVRATALALTWVPGRIYANSVWRIGARVRLLDALRRR